MTKINSGIPDILNEWDQESMWTEHLEECFDRSDFTEPARYDAKPMTAQQLVNFRATEPPQTE